MTLSLEQASGARLPRSALAVLADLRPLPGVTVTLAGEQVWVRWPIGDERVLTRLLPVAGVELYVERAGLWYRHDRYLPSFEVPPGGKTIGLAEAVLPEPLRPDDVPDRPIQPVTLSLVRDEHPRQTTGMLCLLAELGRWADGATTARLAAVRAARLGEQVLLQGRNLPLVPGGERFWGEHVLAPLGFRADPPLPERALLEAAGAGEDDLLLLTSSGAELLSSGAFQPLTRAGIRLASKGGS